MARVIKAPRVQIDYENKKKIITPLDQMLIDREAALHEHEELEPEPETPQEAEKRILAQAHFNSTKIIDEARVEADLIIRTSKVRADEYAELIKKQAEEEGYNEGYKSGRDEAQSIINDAKKTLSDAYDERDEIFANIEPQMVRLIIDITHKLVGDDLSINQAAILHVVREGLRKLPRTENINIIVSQDDYDNVKNNWDVILSCIGSTVKTTLSADSNMQCGDCVIETDMGSIDSGVSQQMQSLLFDLKSLSLK